MSNVFIKIFFGLVLSVFLAFLSMDSEPRIVASERLGYRVFNVTL